VIPLNGRISAELGELKASTCNQMVTLRNSICVFSPWTLQHKSSYMIREQMLFRKDCFPSWFLNRYKLQTGFDSRRYQIFWEVVGLERGPLSLVSTIEELLGRKSSGSCLESREYGSMDPSRWPIDTLYPQKWALTSPTNDGRSVCIVLWRTQATGLVIVPYPIPICVSVHHP
jgi:hypothetical protein